MEPLRHECGVALVRLLKPADHYRQKYGTESYGLNKLYLMMEKQHNRGQEGAGIACVSLDAPVGEEYMLRERAEGKEAITEVFSRIESLSNSQLSNSNFQLLMGHLRYSTTGRHGLQYVHPFLRRNNWRAKNLCLCGNFNMTNLDEVLARLVSQGQSPRMASDAYITLELMGHRLDREVERQFEAACALDLQGLDVTRYIDEHVQMENVLRTSMAGFDGGYVMCALTGSGEMFALRDPWGIRPAFYYISDEVVALASERAVLQTTFDLAADDVCELPAGCALIVRRSGEAGVTRILEPRGDEGRWACSFERIYFSRGSDRDIYAERKRLGLQLTEPILRAIGGDVENTVFSFIPNTAEVAFYGMVEGFRQQGYDVRTEKVAWKDIKLRTFITEAGAREDLAAHVYDITYGCLREGVDQLVIIDDSIVRGTTLSESILKILDRLRPRKIVMVSSSPQVRYPDYYGIDMASLGELCAFRATMALLRERGMDSLVADTYLACQAELERCRREREARLCADIAPGQVPAVEPGRNCVTDLYAPFTVEEINAKMVEMLRPEGMRTPVELVFQSTEGLRAACPRHRGDWYFSGQYPTPGGNRHVNQAFIDYVDRM